MRDQTVEKFEPVRESVQCLIKELGVTQAKLVREINNKSGYRVNNAEFCNALNGNLTTPKANRMLADAYYYLSQMKEARDKQTKQNFFSRDKK